MAVTRTNSLFPNKYSWLYESLLFVVGFVVALGFTAWLGYGMIKEVFASLSLKEFVGGSGKRRNRK